MTLHILPVPPPTRTHLIVFYWLVKRANCALQAFGPGRASRKFIRRHCSPSRAKPDPFSVPRTNSGETGAVTMQTLALLIVALCCASGVSAGGPPKTLPRLSDIPFIRCQVCRVMVENAYEQAKELRANATPEFPVRLNLFRARGGEAAVRFEGVQWGGTIAVPHLQLFFKILLVHARRGTLFGFLVSDACRSPPIVPPPGQ